MKKIFLLIIILTLTGCSVQYDLEIDEDTISEKVNVSVLSSEVSEDAFLQQVSIPLNVYPDKDKNYAFDTEFDGNFKAIYSYDHDFNDYSKSAFLNKCYDYFKIEKDYDSIALNTNSKFNCIVLEDDLFVNSVTVNITTDLKVIKNNADEVNGNTYTWKMDESNYTNKPISMVMEIPSDDSKLVNQTKDSVIMILIFAVPILIVGIILYFKSKKRNEF